MTKKSKGCENIRLDLKHIAILEIMMKYKRSTPEIQDIALSTINIDFHNGVLRPRLAELQRWGYIQRLNPNASRREGYQYAITPTGKEKVKEFVYQFQRMADMRDQFA